jgi:hypothetical protein
MLNNYGSNIQDEFADFLYYFMIAQVMSSI